LPATPSVRSSASYWTAVRILVKNTQIAELRRARR
jgi:hypothetical protein